MTAFTVLRRERNSPTPLQEAMAEAQVATPADTAPAGVAGSDAPLAMPSADLALVGILGSGATLQGLFALTEASGATRRFLLGDGHRNEWLEVRSIDLERDRVTVILKKPVVRIRNIGVEVLLSLPTRNGGANERAAAP